MAHALLSQSAYRRSLSFAEFGQCLSSFIHDKFDFDFDTVVVHFDIDYLVFYLVEVAHFCLYLSFLEYD